MSTILSTSISWIMPNDRERVKLKRAQGMGSTTAFFQRCCTTVNRLGAEGEGFEPSIRFPVYTLSKRAPSATRPPLRIRDHHYSGARGQDQFAAPAGRRTVSGDAGDVGGGPPGGGAGDRKKEAEALRAPPGTPPVL